MLKTTGGAQKEDWQAKLPPEERRKAGPYVVYECYQKIPAIPARNPVPLRP